MSLTTYDTLQASTEVINYKTGTDCNLYPDSNNISIFGPLWLPRIYGKDLTAFEIASSGKIAITVNDVHSLDISHNNATTELIAKSNFSFMMTTSNGSMFMKLDEPTSNIYLVAACNIDHTASNNMNIVAKQGMLVSASNGDLALYGKDQSMSFVMEASSLNTTLNSSNDIIFSTSNVFSLTAMNDVDVYAATGHISLAGTDSNTTVFMDGTTGDISIFSSNNTSITTSNDFTVLSSNNVSIGGIGVGNTSLYANTEQVSLTLNGTDNTTSLYSSNDIGLTTSNDFLLTAISNIDILSTIGNVKVSANTDQAYLYLQTSNGTLYTSSDMFIAASNDLFLEAMSNIRITAVNDSMILEAHSEKMSINMSDTTDVLTLYGSNGVNVYSSNDVNISSIDAVSVTSGNTFTLLADSEKQQLEMNSSTHNTLLYSSNNMNITASNSLTLYGVSNLFGISSNIVMSSSSNAVYVASNNILVSASNNLTLSASNTLALEAKDLSFTVGGDIAYTAQSNVRFFIQGAPSPSDAIFQISGSNVHLRGDLFLTGTINTSNILNTTVITETLKVNDKLVYLASVGAIGDSNPFDSSNTNGWAGIQVDGIPDSASNVGSNLWPIYEKSIRWNYGVDGTKSVGTSNLEKESAWEVCGGGLRVTKRYSTLVGSNTEIKDTSFTFRVGHTDELELVKTWWNGTAYVNKRIAKFGKILS
jgi:uncharacterized protein (DUF2345 family)